MMKRKSLLAVLAVVMCVCVCVGGTIAYLIAQTDPVVNTFTPSGITVTLAETNEQGDDTPLTNTYKVIPGYTVRKDPKVTITNDVDAYLFVKVTGTDFWTIETQVNFDGPNVITYISNIDYMIADGWTLLESDNLDSGAHLDGVYYREVVKDADTKTFSILKDDQITFVDTLTAADVAKSTTWQLSFDAYAVQKMQNDDAAFTPAEAWAQVNPNP